jgi:hypothetical protein
MPSWESLVKTMVNTVVKKEKKKTFTIVELLQNMKSSLYQLKINLIKKSQRMYGSLSLKGASHFFHQVERALDKLASRRQGWSSLKYPIYGVCISLERKICPLEEDLGFHYFYGQAFVYRSNLLKTHKNYCHISILECIVLWLCGL